MATKLLRKTVKRHKIPTIGLGTWMSNKTKELERALEVSLECGYRYIDTAYAYQNEVVIGKVINKWINSKKLIREDVFITTKLPMCGLHVDRIGMFMKKSLDNLQLSFVNLYMIQFPVGTNISLSSVPANEVKVDMSDHIAVWRKMEDQLDAGRTRMIGLSNFNQRQISRILACCRIKPSFLEIELHVFLQQKELVNFCNKNDIGVIAYAPLGRPYSLDSNNAEQEDTKSKLCNPVIAALAEKYEKTNEQIMLRYLLEKGVIPIPMSLSPKSIKQNINIFDFHLDKEDIKELEKLDQGNEGRIVNISLFPEAVRQSPEFPFP